MRSQGVGQLYTHVSESAQANHADSLSFADVPMAQWRVGRDAGAEQGCDRRQVEVLRNPQDESLVYDDRSRVTAIGHAAQVFVFAVISENRRPFAVVLQARPAAFTFAAGVNQAADPGQVARLKFVHFGADFCDPADNFVSGHDGVDGVSPFVACRMKIGMADAAIQDFYLDVLRARLTAFERKWG